MAAFGAAPMKYRPNQDDAAGFSAEATTAPSSSGQVGTPAANPGDRILPGGGGRVREVFPLLWRAIPVVGDLKVGAIKRPGDEVPEVAEKDTAADLQWSASLQPTAPAAPPGESLPLPPPAAAPTPPAPGATSGPTSGPVPRVVPFVAADAKPASPFASETATRAAAGGRSARPLPGARTAPPDEATAATEVSPAQWAQQAYGLAPPPAAVAAVPPKPLAPLRSHAELIRPVGQRAASPDAEPAGTPPPATAEPAAPQPAAPRPAAPQPAATGPMPPTYPAPAQPPAPPGPPTYYPPPPLPPPGMHPYPINPGAAGWAQPGYPPYPPPYPLPYPSLVAGYPPPGYPPHYPYGYPQQPGPQPPPEAYAGGYPPLYPPGYGPPQAYPMQPQPQPQPQPAPVREPEQPQATSLDSAPMAEPVATPPEAATAPPPPPATLSDIFAALHRAPGTDHGEETPP